MWTDRYMDVSQILLKYNANVNSRDDMDWVPWHGVSKKVTTLGLLLKHGADVDAKEEGIMPWHVASS